eukprot:TRINITY_DN1106_c2_g1_i1.p1 TRINITY_DN1106_c2_g1~~TRINITY_DN1106_c2_g1_i1.p1  ORF type:complete len:108 (-),score=27.52 TRINITY_DN1106_c2_g1_i1:86-409(-)
MSESSTECISDQQLTDCTLKQLKNYFFSNNFSDQEITQLMQYRKRIKSKSYTRKSRARYRECIKKREFQKSQLQTERKNLLREIAFWKTAVVNEYNDDVFLPAPAQC